MEAGRELDGLVAEKVLGFCWCPHDPKWKIAANNLGSSVWSDDGVWKCTTHNKLVGYDSEVKHYSTDPALALETLEKDDGAGWDFTLTRYAASSVPWQVEAHRHVDGLVISEAGETCALAICRVLLKTRSAQRIAALKAVE